MTNGLQNQDRYLSTTVSCLNQREFQALAHLIYYLSAHHNAAFDSGKCYLKKSFARPSLAPWTWTPCRSLVGYSEMTKIVGCVVSAVRKKDIVLRTSICWSNPAHMLLHFQVLASPPPAAAHSPPAVFPPQGHSFSAGSQLRGFSH